MTILIEKHNIVSFPSARLQHVLDSGVTLGYTHRTWYSQSVIC